MKTPDIQIEDTTDEQKEWLNQLAEKKNITPEKLLQLYLKQAKKSRLISWMHSLFNDAMAAGITRGITTAKVEYACFICPGKTSGYESIEVIIPSTKQGPSIDIDSELLINTCWNIPELQKFGRLIALSNPISSDYYPNLQVISKLRRVEEIEKLPQAIDCFEPTLMSDVYKTAVTLPTGKGFNDVIIGTVLDVRTWESGAYVVLNDGSPLPHRYIFAIQMDYDNIFDITRTDILESHGKKMLAYGWIKYQPKEEKRPEGVRILPSFVKIIENTK